MRPNVPEVPILACGCGPFRVWDVLPGQDPFDVFSTKIVKLIFARLSPVHVLAGFRFGVQEVFVLNPLHRLPGVRKGVREAPELPIELTPAAKVVFLVRQKRGWNSVSPSEPT